MVQNFVGIGRIISFIASMIKTGAKYLITLSILLLSISGQLVANTCYSCASYQQVKNQRSSKNIDVSTQPSIFISPSFIFNNHENFLFVYDEKFEEDDKDDVILQKRNVENEYILSPLFKNSFNKPFFLKNSQALRFSKHFLHIPYNKLFIVFQVFRI